MGEIAFRIFGRKNRNGSFTNLQFIIDVYRLQDYSCRQVAISDTNLFYLEMYVASSGQGTTSADGHQQ